MGTLRIIGGEFRSRRIVSPRGHEIRPTSDRAREALFSIMAGDLAGVTFLDLFAGTGAVGLEAISRGAAHATFVEHNAAAAKTIGANIESLGLRARCVLIVADWRAAGRRLAREGRSFGVVFADPPYDDFAAVAAVLPPVVEPLLSPGGLLIIEHRHGQDAPAFPEWLDPLDDRRSGEAVFSFYRRRP